MLACLIQDIRHCESQDGCWICEKWTGTDTQTCSRGNIESLKLLWLTLNAHTAATIAMRVAKCFWMLLFCCRFIDCVLVSARLRWFSLVDWQHYAYLLRSVCRWSREELVSVCGINHDVNLLCCLDVCAVETWHSPSRSGALSAVAV